MHKRLNRSRCRYGEMIRMGPRNHVLHGVKIPRGNGQFLGEGVVRPIKKH